MLDLQVNPPVDFPDDPLKWDGWSNYNADNPYARLCISPGARPNDEQIQDHCTALLQWWQKKLRLKNQPSNPLTKLLGRGIDEAPACLVEARMLLLDPERRRQVDDELAAQSQQHALADFSKYVAFSLAGKLLTAEAEIHLTEFGQRNGLSAEQTRACIEEELRKHKAQRAAPPVPDVAPDQSDPEAEKEFLRILHLSKLDLADAYGLVKRIFTTIAENLGIRLERAEHLLDDYLEKNERDRNAPAASVRYVPVVAPSASGSASSIGKGAAAVSASAQIASAPCFQRATEKPAPSCFAPEFTNPIGTRLILIPAGEFLMGSDASDAAPNEQPITPVALSEFYLSRHPITNAQFEEFNPRHRQKRLRDAGDDHPAVYVTSIEADKFCQWLGLRDGKSYRLPTEAEWEYAARGSDGRKYPWGNHERRGGFANFADASTAFPWRDPQINDGYPETSPVGAFPLGASFFGLEDMAGNVWEWCLDFYQPLAGTPKRNPRGTATGSTRVYRGGSWKSRFSNLRTTARSSNAANYASNDVGFRIVCECSANGAVS